MARLDEQEFVLSESGAPYSDAHTDVMAYLQTYGFPYPPNVRYGNCHFDSPQENHRVRLFGQAWLPPDAKGIVLLIHGYGEHVGNYSRLINDLVRVGFGVTAIDLRGHGLSEGPRGHTDTPECYTEDLEEWLKIVMPSFADSSRLYLWAHSLGAQIGLQLLLRNKLKIFPTAACFTSLFIGFPAVTGIQKLALKVNVFLEKFAATLQIPTNIPPEHLSSDKEYLKDRAKDPLIISHCTPTWAVCMQQAFTQLQSHASEYSDRCPTLLMLPGEEKVVNLLAARAFAFNALSSLKHKVIEFPKMLHELEKESVRPRVVQESIAWFSLHN